MSGQEREELPVGWPKDIPFPLITPEEARDAVQNIEKRIADMVKQRKGKLMQIDPDMASKVIGPPSGSWKI